MKTLGKHPSSPARLKRLLSSPNYRDGTFQNIHPTSMSKEGGSTFQTAIEFFMNKKPLDIKPAKKIPGFKIDLHSVSDETPSLVWFGHSSYLIKYKSQTILVDPVFSGHAAPIASAVNSFEGTDIYQVEDLPPIDVLLLTHDHYDHADFKTITLLKDKVKRTVCPLGVGEHLEHWGYSAETITELDWWESQSILSSSKVTATPARHFSGRSLTRNKTLWASYVLELDSWRLFIGGDSGYDDQFKKIGGMFKSFDLVMLECGQYGLNWPFIHMFPEQTAQAAVDLNAKTLFPVHWGKFILSVHSWTEPIERLLVKTHMLQQKVTTPHIGEVLRLGEVLPDLKWWKSL
jgi:L-ascorbate metabolism protein UlaG (beta-lactamase superfamily)